MKKCFFEIAADSDFSIHNLPYGVGIPKGGSAPAIYVAIGDRALNLTYLEAKTLIQTSATAAVFASGTLNTFASLGRPIWKKVRQQIEALLTGENPVLLNSKDHQALAFQPLSELKMLLPFQVQGFTDFYASEYHATNVGRLFRGDANALLPNWKHIPIAYNGRASTVVIDGTPVRRPLGQLKRPDVDPVFGPSQKLDFELEVGFFVGRENALGQPITFDQVEDYLFGLVLVNDWSARDIQSWEYQPLGPFLGKSFATTISPWVVPFEALEKFKVPLRDQNPKVLPYLEGKQTNYNLSLKAELVGHGEKSPRLLCETNLQNMYWSFAQQLVHHASNGCVMRIGDLVASGTLSGAETASWASLLELTFDGKKPLDLPGLGQRSYLQDGDTLILSGEGIQGEVRIGFGRATGQIVKSQLRLA